MVHKCPQNEQSIFLAIFTVHPIKSRIINGMTVEEVWASHPQFQLYELGNFKKFSKNIKKLTSKRKALVSIKEVGYQRNMLKLLRSKKTSRDVSFLEHSPSIRVAKNI